MSEAALETKRGEATPRSRASLASLLAPAGEAARADRRHLALLAAVWVIVIFAVGLGGDFPLNDDWAYAWSAKTLAAHGRLRILDWAAPSLVSHIAWGALLLRIFGDDHRALRCGTLCFGFAGVVLVYALARRAGHPPRLALLAALGLECSPWFVNLSFTYMTDVPWLTWVLASLYAMARSLGREGPRNRALALSGTLLGVAALTRQFAAITAPAFILALLWDERRRGPLRAESVKRFIARSCSFGLPLVTLYGAFQYWYTRIHGVTAANRDVLNQLFKVPAWHSASYLGATAHYLGLWIFPIALVSLCQRRLRPALGWIKTPLAAAFLLGFAYWAHKNYRNGYCGDFLQSYMPYLSNIFYSFGLGPPTTHDSYLGVVPAVHSAPDLNIALTLASTLGGLWAIGILCTIIQRIALAWLKPDKSDPVLAGQRVLLFGVLFFYLSWHWLNDGYLFDRYLLPALPIILLLALDVIPAQVSGSRWTAIIYLVTALWSVAGTREYMSWNEARFAAVTDLSKQGIPDTDVDAGFEINGQRHFLHWFEATHTLMNGNLDFWVHNTHYRISFQPYNRVAGCKAIRRYPYWSWPGAGEQALYVLKCP